MVRSAGWLTAWCMACCATVALAQQPEASTVDGATAPSAAPAPAPAAPAPAAPAPVSPAPAAPSAVDVDEDLFEEVVVYGDLFARWDDTRWFVQTEIGLPFPMLLQRDEDVGIRANAMQVRAVIRCNKQSELGRKRMEVDCVLEDIGLQVVPFRNDRSARALASGQSVLDEIDAKLTDASLQLQVSNDGRVTNVDLEGVPKTNRRIANIQETLRQVMSRVVVGFDMKLRKGNQLYEGKWMEYNSNLMTMPVPPDITGVSGSSMLVHYLNKYKGHVLVQTIGKGVVAMPIPDPREGEKMINYKTDLIGVSIFDAEEGFMIERVWALSGDASASALFQNGIYQHAGRINMLGEKEAPDCGPTRLVQAPGESTRGMETWVSIEGP
jgi:hypothetical protein